MMLYDAHAHIHLHPKPFKIIEKFIAANGTCIANVLSDFKNLNLFAKIYKKYPKIIHNVVGIHPEYVKEDSNVDELLSEFTTVIESFNKEKIPLSAIGEIGLDTYWQPNSLKKQIKVLEAQLEIAHRLKLPIVLHFRAKDENSYSQLIKTALDIFKQTDILQPIYFHSFVGNKELARQILDFGETYLGFNGIITYSSAKQVRSTIEYVPISRILLETDAPFLIPSNMPRDLLTIKDKNEPLATLYVAKLIAKIKGTKSSKIINKSAQGIFLKHE